MNYDAWKTWTPDQDEDDWEVASGQAQALWDSGKCPICEKPLEIRDFNGETARGCSGTCSNWAPFDNPERAVELGAERILREATAHNAMAGASL